MEQPPETGDYGYYGPGSIAWKIGRETIVLLGGSRALLMQIAHPLVAMGVSEHSTYISDPFGRAMRTFMLGEILSFGSSARAHQAARTINHLHYHVHGTLPAQAGAYPSGTRYDARDPQLLLWVHATLIDTILLTYKLFIGPLQPHEENEYYQESKAIAQLLGLSPTAMPDSIEDLQQYVNDMVHSNRLAATPQARQIARKVLFPPVPLFLRPLLLFNFHLTCALLPQPVREIYGMEWGTRRQRVFDLSARGSRIILPRLPMYLRELPITRKIIRQTLGESA